MHDDQTVVSDLVAQALEHRDETGTEIDLGQLCEGRPDLRPRVEVALKAAVRLPMLQSSGVGGLPMLGEELRGRYRIDQRIGAGAMGVVYAATDLELRRNVAIKVLHHGVMERGQALARFEREAEALAAVRQECVVTIYDRGHTRDGAPFLIMELVQGVPLSGILEAVQARTASPGGSGDDSTAWLEQELGLDRMGEQSFLRLAVSWCADVAGGLVAIHGAGIVHRDVKPSNIMIRQDGRPVILDFGAVVTAADSDLTRAGAAVGTPAYMAPEALGGAEASLPPSDVYGLCATLYHLSYYAARSQNISRALVGQTAVEATALSLGYDGTSAGTADVDALDFSIGVRTFDPSGSNSSMFFPNLTTYYFSTTPSTLSAWAIKYPLGKTFAVDNTGSSSVNMPLPLPYHIYKMDWSGNAWGPIELYRSGSSLGLDLGVDDIDALAINAGNGVVVFSTALITGHPGPQLQINTGNAASTTTLTDVDLNGTRTRVEDQLDLGDEKDDIDGLCGIDPEGGRNYDRLAGLPVASLADSPLFASGASMMGVSLERGVSAMGWPENLMIQVSGWGRATPMDGELLLLVYEGQYPLLPNSDPFAPFTPPNSQNGPVTPNWAILGPFPRGAALGQWELEVPFNLNSGSGRHFALCAVQYVGAAASGQIAAGSLVTQFTW